MRKTIQPIAIGMRWARTSNAVFLPARLKPVTRITDSGQRPRMNREGSAARRSRRKRRGGKYRGGGRGGAERKGKERERAQREGFVPLTAKRDCPYRSNEQDPYPFLVCVPVLRWIAVTV